MAATEEKKGVPLPTYFFTENVKMVRSTGPTWSGRGTKVARFRLLTIRKQVHFPTIQQRLKH